MLNYKENADYSNLQVLYEDNHIIGVVKPSNLLVQGDSSNDISLIDIVRKYLSIKYNKKGNVFLGLVHRLDKPACGIVIFGRTSKAASRLSEQFRNRQIKKYYLAIVEGELPDRNNKILKNFLKRKGSKTIIVKPNSNDKEVQYAELIYNVIEVKNGLSLLRIQLITGRKHQIRAQLSEIGFPIYGDRKYNAKTNLNINAIALLSQEINFTHPTTKEAIKLSCEIPTEWNKLWNG